MRQGFKLTDAGVIPLDWSPLRLGTLVNIKSGESPSLFEFLDFGVPYFKVEQLNNDNKYLQTTQYKIRPDHRRVPKGSLIFPKRGASILLNKVRILQEDSFMDTNLMTLTPAESVCNEFLYYALTHVELWRIADTTSIPQINNKHIQPLQIPFPPTKVEQEAIAEALSDADAYIESLEKLIAKKRLIKQGAMQELLTGKRRLPGFSGEWETYSLIELAEGRKELFDDGDWIEAEHIKSQGIRLIQTGNIGVGNFIEKDGRKYISEESFHSLRCKELREGDLLICRLAEPAGRACVLPNIGEHKIITSVDVTIFRPPMDKANRVFLASIFSTNEWFRLVSDRSGGTTHKRISRGALGRIEIMLPPIDEQHAIAKSLSAMEKEISALDTKLNKATYLKQGMMQELLTGRIRLV